MAVQPPRVRFSATFPVEPYARKRNRVVIRHVSDHRVVAVLEIISPGNKASRHAFTFFVQKSLELFDAGIHLLILDLLPPGPRSAGNSAAPSATKSVTPRSCCLRIARSPWPLTLPGRN